MYYDILTRIKNAQAVRRPRVKAPFNKADLAVLEVLEKNGFIGAVTKKGRGIKRILDVDLKYRDQEPVISGLKFVSLPSRRVYVKSTDLRQVRQGFGIGVVSTSKGVMSSREAKKSNLGGEYLFEIW